MTLLVAAFHIIVSFIIKMSKKKRQWTKISLPTDCLFFVVQQPIKQSILRCALCNKS